MYLVVESTLLWVEVLHYLVDPTTTYTYLYLELQWIELPLEVL